MAMAGKAQPTSRARLLRVDPGIGWRIRRFLGSPGHVVGALLGIVGILLLDAGLIHGLLAVAVIVGLYAIGYFFASRPQITQNIGGPAKDSDKIEAGLDQMLSTIRRRVAPDIYAPSSASATRSCSRSTTPATCRPIRTSTPSARRR